MRVAGKHYSFTNYVPLATLLSGTSTRHMGISMDAVLIALIATSATTVAAIIAVWQAVSARSQARSAKEQVEVDRQAVETARQEAAAESARQAAALESARQDAARAARAEAFRTDRLLLIRLAERADAINGHLASLLAYGERGQFEMVAQINHRGLELRLIYDSALREAFLSLTDQQVMDDIERYNIDFDSLKSEFMATTLGSTWFGRRNARERSKSLARPKEALEQAYALHAQLTADIADWVKRNQVVN